MKANFDSSFADFLEERLGKVLFELREKNVGYRNLSDKYAVLLNVKRHSIEEYRQAIPQITDICAKLSDIEKRALFLAGMREHAKMEDALLSDEFEKLFTE